MRWGSGYFKRYMATPDFVWEEEKVSTPTETLRQRAERYIATECISRAEWTALVTELLNAKGELQRMLVKVLTEQMTDVLFNEATPIARKYSDHPLALPQRGEPGKPWGEGLGG